MLQKRKEGCIRGANSMEEFVKVVMKLLNSTWKRIYQHNARPLQKYSVN